MSSENVENSAASPVEVDEPVIFVKFPVDKKLLMEKSPVFEAQFSELWESSPDKALEYLNIDDFSPQARIAFLGYMYGNTLYFASHAKDCALTLELFRMADKYQMVALMAILNKATDDIKVDKTEVFTALDAVLEYIHLAPTENFCKKILSKCADAVNNKEIDLLELWAQYGKENGKALMILHQELKKRKVTVGCFQFRWFSPYSLVHSTSCTIGNVPWRMTGNQRCQLQSGTIAGYVCYVECLYTTNQFDGWSITASVETRVVNQDTGAKMTFQSFFNHVFSPTSNRVECPLHGPWISYIKNNAIILEAEIKIHAMEGIVAN